jgi:hypothetical protein
MSIESLVSQFGMTLYHFVPTTSTGADGQVSRSYAATATSRIGFVQPTSANESTAQGRNTERRTATVFRVDVDDEFHDAQIGAARTWRVTGRVNPGELATTFSASRLSMMAVDVIEIEPVVDVGGF